ncbi:spx domain-containing membrane protein at4g22990-like [Nannochloropsis oceanica]
MVRFEKFLNASKELEWESYYIAYGELKIVLRDSEYKRKLLTKMRASNDTNLLGQSQHSNENIWMLETTGQSMSADALEDTFSKFLDREVEKVVIFFLKAQGDIASKLLLLRLRMRALGPVEDCRTESRDDNHHRGERADSMNTRKSCILKSLVPTTPTTSIYRRRMTVTPSDLTDQYQDICMQLTKLLRFVEINADAVRKILKKHDRRLLTDDQALGSYLTTRVSRNPDSHLRQLFWHNGLNAIVSSLKGVIEEMPANCRTLQDSYAIHVQDKEAIESMVGAFEKVQKARAQVRRKTTAFTNFLSLKPLIFDQEELEIGDIHDLLPMIPHGLSVWLNIAQIFLSTVNNYITVPTTNKYAENLGLDPAYSGIIIGMSPLAQIFSAFLFSYWSNYAFKMPLLVSCVLQLIGNIFYGTAIGFNSLPMLLLGRFLGGAGTAEAVNRRFIADVIPPNERTGASVAFVTASALAVHAEEEQGNSERRALVVHSRDEGGGVNYGGVSCLPPSKVEEQVGPADPPNYFTSPSSTITLNVSNDTDGSTGWTRTSNIQEFRHPLAKIHPILLLVWRNKPLMITLAVYFLIEIADEIILSSAGLIATSYFNWTISHVGAFMAMLGLMVLPANFLVGAVSESGYEDRTIIVTSQAITIAGLLVILSYWGEYNEFQFVAGTSVIFVAVAVMEGVDTSLMSKVIPPVLSRGTFNSGLLAVQIGMVAKALGDGLITVIGLSADDLINGLYIPILIISVGLLLICMRYFKHMS